MEYRDNRETLHQPEVCPSYAVPAAGHSALAPQIRTSAEVGGHGRLERDVDLRVQTVQRIMLDNLHRKLSLGELADAVNLSAWRLCHVFRSEISISPIQYLRFLRMERARYLLETSFLSVVEITRTVGVQDQSHFVRDFKKAYGKTPTFYRTRFKQADLSESKTA